jgi:hypothetical protein
MGYHGNAQFFVAADHPAVETGGGQFQVRERVIESGGQTINIASIASMSVATRHRNALRWGLWFTGALVTCLGLFNEAVRYFDFGIWGTVAIIAFGAVLGTLGFFARSFSTMTIRSVDGARLTMSSPDCAMFNEIQAFLTDKINRHDNLSRRSFEVANATRQQWKQAEAQARPRADQPLALAMQAVEAAEAAADHPVDGPAYVDYGAVLGQVTELQRFYARQPDAAPIGHRLSELELLMRAGSPSPQQKARVSELALDLGTVMQGYPPMAQLFQHIQHLASH